MGLFSYECTEFAHQGAVPDPQGQRPLVPKIVDKYDHAERAGRRSGFRKSQTGRLVTSLSSVRLKVEWLRQHGKWRVIFVTCSSKMIRRSLGCGVWTTRRVSRLLGRFSCVAEFTKDFISRHMDEPTLFNSTN
jgi:hypothetical protein